MVRQQNIENLKTEKKGIDLIQENIPNFIVPILKQKHEILDIMGINRKRFIRTFDGILLHVDKFDDIETHRDFDLIEIKNTKRKLDNFPSGFFFGLTLNEECLLRVFDNFSIVFVNVETNQYTPFMKYEEYDSLINNKRIQYQINFKKIGK